MRGKVIAYNDVDARGIISGDDGQRYGFVRGSLGSNPSSIRPGQEVDFEVTGNQAANIYVIGGASAQIGTKSKIAAGLLAIFLGGFGIHKFYLGSTTAGIIMLVVWLFGWVLIGIPTLIISVIALIEGIIYLTKSDEDFYQIYEVGKKSWF
jgi:TM2 domain-containing membrane protein YozV/cold shock CspA family protein